MRHLRIMRAQTEWRDQPSRIHRPDDMRLIGAVGDRSLDVDDRLRFGLRQRRAYGQVPVGCRAPPAPARIYWIIGQSGLRASGVRAREHLIGLAQSVERGSLRPAPDAGGSAAEAAVDARLETDDRAQDGSCILQSRGTLRRLDRGGDSEGGKPDLHSRGNAMESGGPLLRVSDAVDAVIASDARSRFIVPGVPDRQAIS